MDDAKLEAFNNDIEELASQLDALSATPNSEVSCPRLSELKTVQEKLIAVMGQKSGFILAQLEAEGSKAPVSPYAKQPFPASGRASTASAPAAPRQQAELRSGAAPAWSANLAQTPPPPAPRQPAASAQPERPAFAKARTRSAGRPGRPRCRSRKAIPLSPPPAPASRPVPPPPAASRLHGRGNPSGGARRFWLADLRPCGPGEPYLQAIRPAQCLYRRRRRRRSFLAGLRYGEGKLFTRLSGIETGPTPIYWQGPTLGADLGANGSQTLFLVYNLQDTDELVPALSRPRRLGLCRGRPGDDGLSKRRHLDRPDPHRVGASPGREHRLSEVHRAGQPEPVLVSLTIVLIASSAAPHVSFVIPCALQHEMLLRRHGIVTGAGACKDPG